MANQSTEPDAKEDRILVAATGLFSTYGLGKTTVDEIARAAGVGKGTVYLHFKSKEDLFCAVVRRQEASIAARVRVAVRKQVTVEAKLRAFVATRYRLVQEFLKGHRVSLEVLAEVRPEVNKIIQEFRHDQRLMVETILEEGKDSGELVLEHQDVSMVSLAITSMLDSLDAPWIFEGRALRLERKVDVLIRLIIKGIGR